MLLSVTYAFAQLDQGQIAGTVTDPSRDSISAAQITIVSAQTGRRTATKSGLTGAYVVPNLPIGTYSVEVEAPGFRKFIRESVKVDTATRTTVDAQLTIGAVTDAITVTAEAQPVQDSSAQLGRVVEAKQISDLALNGRNPINLALIKAGVVGSNFNAFNPTGLGTGLSINGGQMDGNNVTIDGVSAVRTRGDGQSSPALLGVFNADALQEVQILTSSYPAEYGRASDGQIRFVTKSGSRDFHGTAWYFIRNSALDANSWVRNAANTFDSTRPAPFRFNQPGFSLGGPVVLPGKFNTKRDKLFFFVAEEWISYRQEKTGSAIVPSAAMRTGNFSELLSASNPFFRRTIAVRDPLNSTPFPNNIIPSNRLSANGTGLLRAFPLPTAGFQQGASNWIDSQPNPRDIRKDTVRVDYMLGASRLSFTGTNFYYAEDDPFRGGFTVANTRWRRPNRTGAFSVSSTLSSNKVNEFTATAANDVVRMTLYPFDGVNRYERSRYGINFGYLIPGPKRVEDRIPTIDITGFTSLDGSSKPGSSSGPMVSISDNFTWILNSGHTLKFGAFVGRDTQINADQIAFNQNGWFTFRDTGNPATTGNALANAALGNFDTYFEIGTAADTHVRSNAYEFFAQDTWKLRPNLTLELGIRYSYFAPWTAKWNDISNFDPRFFATADRAVLDPRTGAIIGGDPYNGIVQGGTSYPDSAKGRALGAAVPNVQRLFRGVPEGFVNKYYANFAPRAGLAWRLDSKSVLRIGGGSFKARDFLNNGSLFRNAPNQGRVDVVNGVVDSPGGRGGSQFPFGIGALALEYNYPTAYHYSFSLQRELPFGIVMDAAYVGKTAVDLYRVRNLNQLLPGTVQANPGVNVNALRPYYGLAAINYSEQSGRSRYDSFQLSLDRRFRNGLGFGVAYTRSKNEDNVATPYDAYSFVRALSGNDRPHVLSLNYIYQLPFLRNSRSLAGNVLGNWQVSGVAFFRSGSPLSVVDATDTAGVGSGSASRPWNVSGSTAATGNTGVGLSWFNPAAFTVPRPGTFGNAGLNILRGPGFQNGDVALFKNFRFSERVGAQVRAEAFNFLNHPLLSNPTTNPRSGDFSRVTSKYNERNLQLGVKILF
ncbi:MAG: TonB-dependent receptor [Bryobacterales bacterium]|nr:TonB-dependent receptor [Bryobacterales bacterium]